ncbi:zinc metallopeptidase, partial [Winogradskyella poriferorum]|uniref:zinc metallopeptidase n=1 Tax=Winogradskyella poriferorum TaxID=307627 RepID=UPI003D65CAD7
MSHSLVIGGLIMGAPAGLGLCYWVAAAGLVFMGAATLFRFITLPVGYGASNRALAWVKNTHMACQQEY